MNLKAFAREIGVSLPTVSRVLNHCFGVDEKTRAYVREDPAAQGRRAMALAREYCETRMFPSEKRCLLPTDVWVHPAFAATNKKEMCL